MSSDGGTYARLNRFDNIEEAEKYSKERIYNPEQTLNFSKKKSLLFSNPRELFNYAKNFSKKFGEDPKKYFEKHNESLVRIKWNKNDMRCQIGIFNQSLESGLIAQFRAMDLKINLNTNFIPMSFYLSEGEDSPNIFEYTLTKQMEDIRLALSSEDNPQLNLIAKILH